MLVYSDDLNTRQQVILALGRRVHPDLPELEYVEVATEPVVIQNMDAGQIDLAILDGEAVPAGGMGIAKQLKDEIYQCPPLLVLTGRPQDAWLATWSRADAAVPHPIDPIQLAEAVTGLLRSPVVCQSRHELTRRAHLVMSTWPEVLGALVARTDLTVDQATWAMGEILAGEATPAQIAGFAVSLRAKGETVEEISGLVAAMYEQATPIEVSGRLLDVVGTGGDRSMSVNISTMAAIVAAGAGARVVKHGNRSASSQSGSADVLEALGIRLDLPPERVAALADEAGITFCFAAAFNPAMRHTAVPRRELGIGTTFNFLGPLANPTQPAANAVGCADPRMAPVMAGVFAARGADAWVFRGDDGLDELTTTTTSSVWVVAGGEVSTATVDPAAHGLAPATMEDLRGGDAAHNADVVRRLLDGDPGPVRDAVLLNAGAALAVYDAPGGPVDETLDAGHRPGPRGRRLRCGQGHAGALGGCQQQLEVSSVQPGGACSISRSSLWCRTVQSSTSRRL